MPKKLTTEEFIKKSKKIHGDRYDYSLVEYKNTHTKVKIICNEHGEYIQKPYKHIYGQGCPYCVGKNKTTDQFIKECVGVHGDLYDYSLVDYTGMFSNIIVVCGTHGRFEQIAHNHVNGHGCGVCSGTIKKTTELFITDAQQIHGDKYDYSLVDYQTAKTKVKIICKSHGVYETTPNTHLNGRECPNCRTSKGERRIMDILNLCNISYKREVTFPKLLSDRGVCLRFDFNIPNKNLLIEFDGEQHFKHIKSWITKENYDKLRSHDRRKNEFCRINGIGLLRIRFDEYDKIEELLHKYIL